MRNLLSIMTLLLALTACSNKEHLIKDEAFREKVTTRFEERKGEILKNREKELLTVFNSNLTLEEEEALKFIYAYAPLCDLADYTGEFYIENIREALASRSSFTWSPSVPNELFINYVLPLRSSNENIDGYRASFYNELEGRIKDMTMLEAAMEVNHWCHEKVTYKGTDIRTMSPTNTLKTAYGRCGEESVFAVAAYRSVGIPARQVYTPRWAHSDDNHAWIEVWVDGKWYFTGACEPAPKLNMGWFSSPAGRGILMRASAFGELPNSDFRQEFTGYFTYTNVTSNYTTASEIEIEVVTKDGKPVEGVNVGFSLYNFAELYPVTSHITDKSGKCKAELGQGDVLLWLNKGDKFTYKKITVGSAPSFKVIFEQKPISDYEYAFDMVPPVESIPFKVSATKEEIARNNKSNKEENAIRKAYEETFISKEAAESFAKKLGLDSELTVKYLVASRGNSKEIMKFLESVSKEQRDAAFTLLEVLSYKDLWDTPADIILDHFNNSTPKPKDMELKFYVENIVSPRIINELILPYKSELREAFKGYDAEKVVTWIKENLTLSDRENSIRMPLSPYGTYQLRWCDTRSRDLFFVAVCRSLGIASRLDSSTQEPTYFKDGRWVAVAFSDKAAKADKGTITIANSKENPIVPVYYKNFSIARLESGVYKTLAFDKGKATLDFPEGINLKDGDITVDIPVGYYMMVSGNRLKDGSVLTKTKFFQIEKGKSLTVSVDIRKDEKPLEVLGKIDLNSSVKPWKGKSSKKLADYVGESGAVVAWLEPDREPTKHFMLDMETLTDKFEKWGGSVVLYLPKDKATESFFASPFPTPTTATYAVDSSLLEELEKSLGQELIGEYPVVTVINSKGEIVFVNKGYRIGLGEQLLKITPKL